MSGNWGYLIQGPSGRQSVKHMFSSEFISSWLQCSVARPCTYLPFIAVLPWHDIKKKTFQILLVLNNVDSSVTRSKMFDVVAVVMKEWPGSRD